MAVNNLLSKLYLLTGYILFNYLTFNYLNINKLYLLINIIHSVMFMEITNSLNRISGLDILSMCVYVKALVMLMVTIYNGFPLV